MTQKWNITVTTDSGETFAGAMTRQKPVLIHESVVVATPDGEGYSMLNVILKTLIGNLGKITSNFRQSCLISPPINQPQ